MVEVHRSPSAEPQHFCNSSKSAISAGLLKEYVRVSEIFFINNFNRCTIDGNGSVIFSGRSEVDNDSFVLLTFTERSISWHHRVRSWSLIRAITVVSSANFMMSLYHSCV